MIEYIHSIPVEEYTKLRDSVGFCKIPQNRAATGLKNSAYLVAAKYEDRYVGTARLISDGGYVAYIADVIVLPEFQGKGIGKTMVNMILEHIKETMQEGESVMTCLMAAKGKEAFYRQFGFSLRPNDDFGAGMSQWLTK